MKKAYIAKQVVIDEIKEKFERAESAVVIDYMGITAAQADAMRKKLQKLMLTMWFIKTLWLRERLKGPNTSSWVKC